MECTAGGGRSVYGTHPSRTSGNPTFVCGPPSVPFFSFCLFIFQCVAALGTSFHRTTAEIHLITAGTVRSKIQPSFASGCLRERWSKRGEEKRVREHRRNRVFFCKLENMAAEVEGVTLSHTHDQLRRQTVKHRMGKRDGLDGPQDVDMGNARDVAIDFMGGVVSGISGIVVGQVRAFNQGCAGSRRYGAVLGTTCHSGARERPSVCLASSLTLCLSLPFSVSVSCLSTARSRKCT